MEPKIHTLDCKLNTLTFSIKCFFTKLFQLINKKYSLTIALIN